MPAEQPTTLRGAVASLMMAACGDLAEHDGAPEIGPSPDRDAWHRYGQETFLALRPDAWRLPERSS